ncbi:hypothetical protein BDN72DRAFT_779442, partial [Pluteus cervinus]
PIQPDECTTGPIQCCQNLASALDPSLLGTLTALLPDLLGTGSDDDVVVGLVCSPIGVLGVDGNSCSAQPVCCQDNNVDGAISVGCVPVNLNA